MRSLGRFVLDRNVRQRPVGSWAGQWRHDLNSRFTTEHSIAMERCTSRLSAGLPADHDRRLSLLPRVGLSGQHSEADGATLYHGWADSPTQCKHRRCRISALQSRFLTRWIRRRRSAKMTVPSSDLPLWDNRSALAESTELTKESCRSRSTLAAEMIRSRNVAPLYTGARGFDQDRHPSAGRYGNRQLVCSSRLSHSDVRPWWSCPQSA